MINNLQTIGTRARTQRIAAQVEIITPAQARDFLTRFPQRHWRHSDMINKLIADIGAGDWSLNGQPVIISNRNNLLDGEKRLRGIAAGNVAVEVLVVYNVSEDDAVTLTIDNCEPRSFAKFLKERGVKYATLVAGTVHLIWRWDNHLLHTNLEPSYKQCIDILAQYPELEEHCAFVGSQMRHLGMTACAAAMTRISVIAREEASAFFTTLAIDYDLSPSHPISVLRHQLLTIPPSRGYAKESRLHLIVTAWNMVVDGMTSVHPNGLTPLLLSATTTSDFEVAA